MKYQKLILVCFVICAVFILRTCCFYGKVKILDEFDFSQNEWLLVKGYHGDSVQYIISDPSKLESLKDNWVLCNTDRNFATTGGYCVYMYKNQERVLTMDLIIDGPADKLKSGILAHYQIGTLSYNDLDWLEEGQWVKTSSGKVQELLRN